MAKTATFRPPAYKHFLLRLKQLPKFVQRLVISKFILAGGDKARLEEEVKAIIANPSAFAEDRLRGELAKALLNAPPAPRTEPIKYRQWREGVEHEAVM